eukprot:scaffold492029_cov18-Prasinocladus_malaysianus.AAC.1
MRRVCSMLLKDKKGVSTSDILDLSVGQSFVHKCRVWGLEFRSSDYLPDDSHPRRPSPITARASYEYGTRTGSD